MGEVYEEFLQELAALGRKHEGRPHDEMVSLWLLSLEREQIVNVAYRDALLTQRLASLPVSREVQSIMRHALQWAWRDEEMHAIYVRGVLLRMRRPLLSARAFAQQVSGGVAGWVSSVRQHVRWRDAPFSRLIATALSLAGRVMGKVSRVVGKKLDYHSFREFCRFNVDAEKTAALAWRRLADVAESLGEAPATVAEYRRIEDDEERHARVFSAFVDALDDEDRFALGFTVDRLSQRVAEAGEFFLVRAHRRETIAGNPLGSGGGVWVAQGTQGDDKRAVFRKLLDDAQLPARIAQRARECGKEVSALSVAVKPSFMMGYHRCDTSGLTDPELLDELSAYLRALGVADVAIVEARNLYDQFYDGRSVAEVARYFGYESPRHRIVDVSSEQVPHEYVRGIAQYSVSSTWKDADFRITFGKLRSHPIEQVYLTLANLEGIGARCEEFLFADRQAHRDAALMTMASAFFPHFALIDGYDSAADGLIGVMGCPRPKKPRRIYAGADAIAVDFVAARHVGVADARTAGLVKTACDWFGDPTSAITVHGVDEPIPGWRGPYDNDFTTFLSFLAHPVYEYGSGRGALFVPEMDREAFPLKKPEGVALGTVRAAIRLLLGLRTRGAKIDAST
jgi:uncharacterized protein (DUF362 family)